MASRGNRVMERMCGTLAMVLLCGLAVAQSTSPVPGIPPATAAAQPAKGTLNITSLPDAETPLTSRTESASQPMHVAVGQSFFIKTPTRLKRIYVSNPVAVDAFASSPRQLVVTAKTAGVSSVILWDEAGQSQTYMVSSDLDVTSLQDQIAQALPVDRIAVTSQQDRISLTGSVASEASSDAAAKLAALYSKNVVNAVVIKKPPRTRQVRLKVQIIEIDRSKLDQFGINLFSNGKNSTNVTTGQFPTTHTYTPSTGTNPALLTYSDPLNLFFYNYGLNIGLTIKDLQNKQVLQILAEPTITTLSGQKASFLSGGEFPFPVVQGSSGGSTSITIQFRSYGVKLEFTPVVAEDGTIQLKVAPEVSALDYTNAVSISGYTIPAISTRRAETQVELKDGQSFAISGLLDHRTTDILSKMPGIGDVPILGQLFRSKNINHSVVELVVVVTPAVVDPLADATVPTLPVFPVPMLEPSQFDKQTGGQKSKAEQRTGEGGKQ